MDVRLRDLRYFVAVAETLSFTQAAERLHLSQPALSKQIRQLEVSLRTTLFSRDRRHVALTVAGVALLPRAQRLLELWDESLESLTELRSTAATVLTVGAMTAIGRDLYPTVVRQFAAVAPNCRLDLRIREWTDVTAGLLDHSSDAALVWLPLPADRTLAHRVLFTEPRWVAMHTAHRLAHRAAVDFAELLDEPFVALPPQAGPLRDFWLAVDERGNRPPRIALNAHSPDEKLEAIASGLGVSLLAAGSATIYQRPGIVCRPVHGVALARFAVAWRRDDDRPLVHAFADTCGAAASELAGELT